MPLSWVLRDAIFQLENLVTRKVELDRSGDKKEDEGDVSASRPVVPVSSQRCCVQEKGPLNAEDVKLGLRLLQAWLQKASVVARSQLAHVLLVLVRAQFASANDLKDLSQRLLDVAMKFETKTPEVSKGEKKHIPSTQDKQATVDDLRCVVMTTMHLHTRDV